MNVIRNFISEVWENNSFKTFATEINSHGGTNCVNSLILEVNRFFGNVSDNTIENKSAEPDFAPFFAKFESCVKENEVDVNESSCQQIREFLSGLFKKYIGKLLEK